MYIRSMMKYTIVGWCILLFLPSCNREETIKGNGLQESFVPMSKAVKEAIENPVEHLMNNDVKKALEL